MEEEGRLKEPEGVGEYKETASSRQLVCYSYELSAILGDVQILSKLKLEMGKCGRKSNPSQPKELLAIYGCSEWERQCLTRLGLLVGPVNGSRLRDIRLNKQDLGLEAPGTVCSAYGTLSVEGQKPLILKKLPVDNLLLIVSICTKQNNLSQLIGKKVLDN